MTINGAHLPLLKSALEQLDSTSPGKPSRFSINHQDKICLSVRRVNGTYKYLTFHTLKETLQYIETAYKSRSAIGRRKSSNSSLL